MTGVILGIIPPNIRPIIVALVASLALIAADAVLNADDIRISVTVSNRASTDGFTRDVVEEFFLYDINQIVRTKSLVQPPVIRNSGSKTIVAVIADALSLNNFTAAVQASLGIDMAQVTATLSSEQGRTGFVLVGWSPSSGEFDFTLHGTDTGIRELLRTAALRTMQHIDPYQTLLYRIGNNPDAEERRRIIEGLEQAIDDPDLLNDRQRRGLLRNLTGIVHLLNGDLASAARDFTETVRIEPTLAVGYNNLAFVLVQKDRFTDAIATVQRALGPEPATSRPELLGSLHSVWGVAAWGMGDTVVAEEQLRTAIAYTPLAPGPHLYLAGMLHRMGRHEEAAKEHALGNADLSFFQELPEVANLYFWMSPARNVPLTRRSEPPPDPSIQSAPPH